MYKLVDAGCSGRPTAATESERQTGHGYSENGALMADRKKWFSLDVYLQFSQTEKRG